MNLSELITLSDVRRWTTSGVARAIRERAKVSQAEVAEVCGVDPSAVGLWERGERAPRGEAAMIYARFLLLSSSKQPGGMVTIEQEMADQAQGAE